MKYVTNMIAFNTDRRWAVAKWTMVYTDDKRGRRIK